MLRRLFLAAFFVAMVFSGNSYARDYIIYGIDQDIDMGDGIKPKKNYYINMGESQGLKQGVTLNVYRVISVLDPYENKKRYNHKVKIGEMTVLHSEKETSIGKLKLIASGDNTPYMEVNNFMVGDKVDLKLN